MHFNRELYIFLLLDLLALQVIKGDHRSYRFNLDGVFKILPDLVVFTFGCAANDVVPALEPEGEFCDS